MPIEPAAVPAPEAAPEQSETATIPASIVSGQEVKPGDVIKLEVVSSDGKNITVRYPDTESPADTEQEVGGMKEMTDKFNEE